jgi:HEAT repeat protein
MKFGWYGSGLFTAVVLALFIPAVRTSLIGSVRNAGDQIQASAKPADRPPGNADDVDKALADLKSSDRFTRLLAASALKQSGIVPSLRQDVVQALIPLVKDEFVNLRQDATEALGVWGGHEEVPILLKALDDWTEKKWNRWSIFTALELLKDPSSAEAVVARLTNREDRIHVHRVLKGIGPPAEPFVWKYLDHPDREVRHAAYGCLQLAGSAISIPQVQAALRRMDKEKDAVDLMYARATLKKLGGSE